MSENVVLLHAIWRTARCMAPLKRSLERQGFTVLNVNYPSTRQTLQELVETIRPELEPFVAEGTVHFVGYSMGGLLVRAYLARHRPAHLGRVVMLGTPNHGSEVADYLKDWFLYRYAYGPAGQQLVTDSSVRAFLPPRADYPLGIIAGNYTIDPFCARLINVPNDGKVSVESTKLEGMADHIVLPVSHTCMPYHSAVKRLTAQFLRTGRFYV